MEKIKLGELVIAGVREVHQNSVELDIIEYNLKGFLNVSNIPGLWIKNLKKNIKRGQLIVGRVIKIDHTVEISLKGISKYEKERKLKEYSKEKKAVRMFNRVCSEYKIKDEKIERAIADLKENFGGVYKAIEKMREGEDVGLGEEFSDVITRFKTGEKIYELKGELELHTNSGNGIDLIKESLSKLKEVEATYLGSTKFLLKLKTTNPKKGEKTLIKEAEEVISKIKSLGGEGKFKLL